MADHHRSSAFDINLSRGAKLRLVTAGRHHPDTKQGYVGEDVFVADEKMHGALIRLDSETEARARPAVSVAGPLEVGRDEEELIGERCDTHDASDLTTMRGSPGRLADGASGSA